MLESPHDRRRAPHPVSTLRRADGDARPGARDALDTGPVLGLPEMWAPFLVNLLDANRRQAQAGDRTGLLAGFLTPPMPTFELNDDPDDDPDEDEDFDEDDEASDDDERARENCTHERRNQPASIRMGLLIASENTSMYGRSLFRMGRML